MALHYSTNYFVLLSNPLHRSSLRVPSGLDIWYLLHVQGQVCGQNSPLDHLQSGFVLVQGQAAQDLVSLETGDGEISKLLVCLCTCVLASSLSDWCCGRCGVAMTTPKTQMQLTLPSFLLQLACLNSSRIVCLCAFFIHRKSAFEWCVQGQRENFSLA